MIPIFQGPFWSKFDIILLILGAQKLRTQINALPDSVSDKESVFISYDKWLRFSISSKIRSNWEIRVDWENSVILSPRAN